MAWCELDNDPLGTFCEFCGERMEWDCLDHGFYTCINQFCKETAA